MSFRVRLTVETEADLERLFDLMVERELKRDDGDLALAERGVGGDPVGRRAPEGVAVHLPKCRAEPVPVNIPFGSSGHVALSDIEGPGNVVVLAARHQREDDYH